MSNLRAKASLSEELHAQFSKIDGALQEILKKQRQSQREKEERERFALKCRKEREERREYEQRERERQRQVERTERERERLRLERHRTQQREEIARKRKDTEQRQRAERKDRDEERKDRIAERNERELERIERAQEREERAREREAQREELREWFALIQEQNRSRTNVSIIKDQIPVQTYPGRGLRYEKEKEDIVQREEEDYEKCSMRVLRETLIVMKDIHKALEKAAIERRSMHHDLISAIKELNLKQTAPATSTVTDKCTVCKVRQRTSFQPSPQNSNRSSFPIRRNSLHNEENILSEGHTLTKKWAKQQHHGHVLRHCAAKSMEHA